MENNNNIKNNTVSAVGQMADMSVTSFLGDPNAPLRLLVIGNSITRHAPNAALGWHGDWGMAASALEKDYVHRLYAKLTEAGHSVYMRVRQGATWERGYREPNVLDDYNGERDFGADIIVYRLGENVPEEARGAYKEKLNALLDHLSAKGGRVLLTTCFWPYAWLDEDTRAVARERGDVLVELNHVSEDERTMALGLFEHKGVAMHPGDYGMECIANEILRAVLTLQQ